MSRLPKQQTEAIYATAREQYADLGVDTAEALRTLGQIPVSLHCWQGDDVRGFESLEQDLGGGLAVTGSYPGRARTAGELRQDLDAAAALIPGTLRLNLHASYGEFRGRAVDRDAIDISHFQGWIDWVQQRGWGMDFNPTFFSHPLAQDGFTLAHSDAAIRRFWIEHGKRCREIGKEMGAQLGSPCVTNFWVPDGFKDSPADRVTPRRRLAESLDTIFELPFRAEHLLDSVECKLFGLGSESYVVGSHEFYLGYAISRNKVLCLDAGHFHPTETISDKISSVLLYVERILLHVSRGVRWDSDHVVTFTDELLGIAQEVVRGDLLHRVHLGLDFFDASINRVAAWVIGTRNLLKALLFALLEPHQQLCAAESSGDYTRRLALQEEAKSLPFGAVWDYFCLQQDTPVGTQWIDEMKTYEENVLSRR